jgi:hypothetical protein
MRKGEGFLLRKSSKAATNSTSQWNLAEKEPGRQAQGGDRDISVAIIYIVSIIEIPFSRSITLTEKGKGRER